MKTLGARLICLAAAALLAMASWAGASPQGGPPDRVERGDLPAWMGSWRVESAPPFRLMYPDAADRDAAQRLANIGRRVYAEIADVLPNPLLGEVTLIVFPDPRQFVEATGIIEAQTPAAARGEPPTIFLNLPRLRPMTVREQEQTFAHEFSHVFVGRHIEGRIPLWLDEGLAQAVAKEPFDEFALVAARATGNLPRLRDLADRFPSEGPARHLAYAMSRAIVDHIVEEDHPVEGLSGLLRRLGDDRHGRRLANLYGSKLVMDGLQRGWEAKMGFSALILRLLTNDQVQWILISGLMVAAYIAVKIRRRRQWAELEEKENRPRASFGGSLPEGRPVWTPEPPDLKEEPQPPISSGGSLPDGRRVWISGSAASETENQREAFEANPQTDAEENR